MVGAALQPVEHPIPAPASKERPKRSAARQDAGRYFILDGLRFLAMVDIVSMHTVDKHLLGGIGLPMLLLISVALQAARIPPPAPTAIVARRARRLLVPWLFWCAVYTAWLSALAWGHGQDVWSWFHPRMLLYGPVIHLWFVPFVFLSSPIVALVTLAVRGLSRERVLAGMTMLGLFALLIAAEVRKSFFLPDPFGQWAFSLGAIPLGMAVGMGLASKGKRRWFLMLALAATGVLIAILGTELVQLPFACDKWMLRRHGPALAAVCLFACIRGRDNAFTRLTIRTTFGVYLMHPLIFQALREMGVVNGWAWPDFVVVYALSAVLTLAMQACRLGRFV